MPWRRHASWNTSNINMVRPGMDHLVAMPSVYEGGEDHLKPGEGVANEFYSMYNHNVNNPYTSENMRNYYSDFHLLPQTIHRNRYVPGRY